MPKQIQKEQAKAKEEDQDLGTRFAAHWTADENANRPLAIPDIEAARAERRKNYAAIAKEYAPLCFSNAIPDFLTFEHPPSYPLFDIQS